MKNMFEFPVVPAVLLSAFLLGTGCYFFRTRSPFMAVCEWLWAFVLLGLCAVDLLRGHSSSLLRGNSPGK